MDIESCIIEFDFMVLLNKDDFPLEVVFSNNIAAVPKATCYPTSAAAS
jgi:hypothetical protein